MEYKGDTIKEFKNVSLDKIQAIAQEVVDIINQHKTSDSPRVILCGDLGAGKTTLVKNIAKALESSDIVSSPTFVVQKEYESNKHFDKIVHIDLYRISHEVDISLLELDSHKNSLICIEWGNLVDADKTKPNFIISIKESSSAPDLRDIKITKVQTV